jgi:cyclophilin family peptidyl-prolyl cis-trans isomerase
LLFRTRPRNPADQPRPELFDALEQRLALYDTPLLADLPALSAMKNNQDTVVRFLTTQGFIDIELYDVGGPPAANTANNFLNYVRSGRYDGTFFHRLVSNFVLQGGGFSLKDPIPTSTPRYEAVQTDAPIVNQYSELRPNVVRTISMAKLDGNPDSATSQFFINLTDNTTTLGPSQNEGFTVFGQIIGGWDVVTTIGSFSTRNLNQYLAGSQNAFGEVPLSGTNDFDVIQILDAEVIKRKNQTAFFTESAYFPDGFRNGTATATLDLVNPDTTPGAGSQYIVIARFAGGRRDQVIAEGFLFAGAHISIPVYKGGDPTVNRVRGGAAFGYEVRFTRQVAASITTTDFGATYAQSFFHTEDLTATQLQTWSFSNGQKGAGLASYLTFLNISDEDATITATFYPEAGSPFTINKNVRPFRRVGLDAAQLPLVPDGLYSVSITSTKPIVSGLTQYRFFPARASSQVGQVNGFATEGVLPGVIIPSVGQTTVSVLYTGASPTSVNVNFEFVLADGTVLAANAPVNLTTTVRRRVLDLSIANAGLPRNTPFTVRYRVQGDAAQVSASLTSVNSSNMLSTPFQTYSTQDVYFAGGFLDPTNTNNTDVISLYNPFRDAGYEMTYTIRFHFDGAGSSIAPPGAAGTLDGGKGTSIRVRDLAQVLAKVQSGEQFRRYSISITTTFSDGATTVEGAAFAQLTRLDTVGGNSWTMGPSYSTSGPGYFFTDPHFSPS